MSVFDTTTSFFDRSEDELWNDYEDDYQRAMRDAVVGYCPAAYDEQLQISSRFISRNQLFEVHRAVGFANYQGYVLNVQTTIAWDRMGYRYGQEVDAAYRLLMQSQRKFMRRHKVPNLSYTVFERSETFGLHSHGGVHVPILVYPKFRRWLDRRIKRLDRVGFKRRLHVRHRRETAPERAIGEQWRWFRYCMKGIAPHLTSQERDAHGLAPLDTFATFYGLVHRYAGTVTLPRVRISQDMLRKARQEAEYPERWYLIDTEGRYSVEEYRRGEADRLLQMLPNVII